MNRIFVNTLSALVAVAAVAPTAFAGEVALNPSNTLSGPADAAVGLVGAVDSGNREGASNVVDLEAATQFNSNGTWRDEPPHE